MQHNNNNDDTSGVNGDSITNVIARIVVEMSHGNAVTLDQQVRDLRALLIQSYAAHTRLEEELDQARSELGQAEDNAGYWERIARAREAEIARLST